MLSHVLCSQIDGADCCSLGCPTHLCFQTFHDLVESCHHLPEVSIKSFSPYLPTYLICRSLLIGDVHYLSHHEKGLSLKFCTNGKFPIQFHSRDLSFINIMQSILSSLISELRLDCQQFVIILTWLVQMIVCWH